MLLLLALACVPESVDLSADKLMELRAPPDDLVNGDGDYNGGWYDAPIPNLNLDDASAPEGDKKRFLHIAIDDPDWYVVGNVADLGTASNVAVLALQKASGRLYDVSLSALFDDNKVEVDPAHTTFSDPSTGSTLSLDEDGVITADLHAGKLSLVGTAYPVFALPFIQVTRFHEGHGSYQTWGNVQVQDMVLSIGDTDHHLAPGSPGGYDRTLGHQRHEQSWNWFSASGEAIEVETGLVVPFALTLGEDREEARPFVEAQKHPAWAGEDYGKIEEVAFAYDKDEETAETGDWKITGTGLDLVFVPQSHRRDQKGEAWMAETDFNQYYGTVSGTFTLNDRVYAIEEVFAVCEDSLIRL